MLQNEVVVDRYKLNPFVKMKDALARANSKESSATFRLARRNDDRVLLLRYHPHLVKPYLNTQLSRQRLFAQSFITFITVAGFGVAGWLYARLKHDKALRRVGFQRYYNAMTLFDKLSAKGEAKVSAWTEWYLKFEL